jgi:hypothetical protein
MKRHVGAIVWLSPENARVIRWITRTNKAGTRIYGRAPKKGVRLVDLLLRRPSDFGPERIIPDSFTQLTVMYK